MTIASGDRCASARRRGLHVRDAGQHQRLALVDQQRACAAEVRKLTTGERARVDVADRRIHARARRREGQTGDRQDDRARLDGGELVGGHPLPRVKGRHRPVAVGRHDHRHRRARHEPAVPAHAVVGEQRPQQDPDRVVAERGDERAGQAEPRGADRRDRAASRRAQEVGRHPLLARARDRVQPGHREVEEGRLGAGQVDAIPGTPPGARGAASDSRRRSRAPSTPTARAGAARAPSRPARASRAAPRRSSCARRPSSSRRARARGPERRPSPSAPGRRGRRRTAPRPRRARRGTAASERFAVLRISTWRLLSAIASSTAIASLS